MATDNDMQNTRGEAVRWNKRYKEGFYDGAINPHALLTRFWPAISGKHVADIAMGTGRDALYLSEKGFFVTGLERSIEAINITKKTMAQRDLAVYPVLGDARRLPYRADMFDCILVFYFLDRKIMDEMRGLLKKDGIFIYETFLKRQNDIDRQRNVDHLLDDGELFSYFKGFELLYYEETIESDGGKRRAIARAVGRKR